MALKRCGALWSKEDKKGKKYYSGTIELGVLGDAKIMVFENEKKGENQPDMTISLLTDDKEKQDTQ